jgi:sugar/nucleoside kinase (ribokinase family)
MPFLMLGEVLVDLVCEQAAEGIGDARAFTPHFGGAAANVAVSAARAGGRPALAGGAGQDPWGQWLLERLREEGAARSATAPTRPWRRPRRSCSPDPGLRATLGAAAEAGARATESWGAVA